MHKQIIKVILYKQTLQKSGGKLAGGYVELAEEEPAKKKRKIVSRAVRPTLGSQFKAADTSDVKQVGFILLSVLLVFFVFPFCSHIYFGEEEESSVIVIATDHC